MTVEESRDTDARSTRGEVTRRRIVAVAEKLFAERGIEGVSLNDINKAAGQRNKNATHYHFGSKEGLLQAIHDKHEPGIARRRDELLDECEAAGNPDLRALVRAMVRPLAEKLDDPDGGREYVQFCAHTVVSSTMIAMKLIEPIFRLSSVERLASALEQMITEIPDELRLQRALLLAVLLTHSLAEHSRMLEQSPQNNRRQMTELFIANLEDSLVAMLSSPPSAQTLELL